MNTEARQPEQYSITAILFPLFVAGLMAVSCFTHLYNLSASSSAWEYAGTLVGGLSYGLLFLLGLLGMMGLKLRKVNG